MGTYDRSATLRKAGHARTSGNKRKAVKLLTEVIKRDGPDPLVESKLAVLLSELKRPAEARRHFVEAARLYASRGFDAKAVGVYRQALAFLPMDLAFWDAIANEQIHRNRFADGGNVLREARKQFAQARFRHVSIYLLQRQLALEPENWKGALELGLLLRKEGRYKEARPIYEYLLRVPDKDILRRCRAALFLMRPTPPAAWRYVRAILRAR